MKLGIIVVIILAILGTIAWFDDHRPLCEVHRIQEVVNCVDDECGVIFTDGTVDSVPTDQATKGSMIAKEPNPNTLRSFLFSCIQ